MPTRRHEVTQHLNQPHRNLVALLAVLAALSCGNVASAQPPPGFVDASTFGGGFNPTDATSALQAAIDSGSDVWVPNLGTDWNVTPIELTQSNQTILLEEGVVVAAKPGAFLNGSDNLIRNVTKQNVRLEGYGATLRMRQQDYLSAPYTPTQFRFAVGLYGPNGMEIVGLTIENAGGDGIYLGANGAASSQNILIQDVVIDNAYRNGISIIHADNVTIDNVVIANTSGNAPQAGIDFEPNTTTQGIENVVIRDSIIVGNFSEGIIWSLRDDAALIPPVTGTVENVTVIGNGGHGLEMLEGALPSTTIKDSLIIDNFRAGFSVGSDCNAQVYDCAVIHEIEHSAFWGNVEGVLDGEAGLGTGSITGAQPNFVSQFVSTDLHHPYFMYLEPDTPTAITLGASDGGYMGARPVLWTGDMDGDGSVTNDDVQWFIQALVDPAAYAANGFTTPSGQLIDGAVNGDINRDGIFDAGDVGAWNTIFSGFAVSVAVPEPSSILCLGVAVAILASRRQRCR
jgi:hypothetical protein